LFHSFLYRFIRLYSATFRIQVENEKEWMDHLRNGGRVVLCTWHQQFFAIIRHFQTYRNFKPSLMISKSSDGEIVAGVAERSGWHAVRGSSSRDGREALKKMIHRLSQSGLAVHIVDGPKGPAGIVKAGVIKLAHAHYSLLYLCRQGLVFQQLGQLFSAQALCQGRHLLREYDQTDARRRRDHLRTSKA
jgi:lysophospholipid acyltransferase (LPLAT)-like uncharacterized protein